MPNAFAPGPSHPSAAPLFAGAALLDAEKLDVYRVALEFQAIAGQLLPKRRLRAPNACSCSTPCLSRRACAKRTWWRGAPMEMVGFSSRPYSSASLPGQTLPWYALTSSPK